MGQVIMFGLTGGLIPCPASITVMLLCLNTGKFTLGVMSLAAFSLGLAATLVAAGLFAAIGLVFASKRFGAINRFLDHAPMFSAILVGAIGIYMLISSLLHLTA